MSQTPASPDVPSEERRIHALGAAISLRNWHAVEIAHAAIRDAFHARQIADRASRALPSTALAARPEEGWQIKPLEWEERFAARADEDPSVEVIGFEARTPFKTFYEIDVGDAYFVLDYDHSTIEVFETEREAKAAAQADYETRIRSALVAPSTPPTAGDGHD